MKRIAIALLAAAALTTLPVRAGHDTRVTVSGHFHLGPPTPTYVGPGHCPPPPVVHYVPAPAPRGSWREVVVKTWIPERWVAGRDRWGRHLRMLEPGYFTYRTDRVWVDGHNHHRYGYSPHRR
jgi:hypothetical protein